VQTGRTGLIEASIGGHLEVVRLLLDNKADASLADQVHGMEL
jgi:ankyrin repeat protein